MRISQKAALVGAKCKYKNQGQAGLTIVVIAWETIGEGIQDWSGPCVCVCVCMLSVWGGCEW